MTLSTLDYLVGLVAFATTIGGAAGAALLLVQKRTPWLRGTTRVLAWSILTVAALLVVHLVPAALGILSRWSAACAALIAVAAAGAVPVEAWSGREAEPAGDDDPPWSRWLARFGIGVGAAWLTIVAVVHRDGEPSGFDAASAYMPTAARWIQEGSIWGFGDWVPGFFFGTSPGNGSTIVLAWMLPWENDFLARYAIFPFLPMMVLATYCLARELRSPPSVATLLALAAAALPVVVEPAVRDALLDPVLYATFAGGLTFLVRHHRSEEPADLVLGGVGLGIAFGTKLYGFTAVPIVVVVWAVSRLIATHRLRRVAGQTAAVIGLVAAFGGVWVLRNAVETGNPIYPVAVPALGLDAPADPYRELLGSTLLDYVDQPSVWSDELFHQFRIAAGGFLLLLGAMGIAAVVLLVRRRGDRGIGLVALAATGLLGLSYLATPYSAVGFPGDPFIAAANVRYGVPALLAGVGLAGWVTARLPRRAIVIVEAAALIGFADALRIGTVLTDRQVVICVLVAVPLLVAWPLAGRVGPALRAAPTTLVAGGAIVAVVGLVAGGGWYEGRYNASRFRGLDPAIDWVLAHSEDGREVAIAGAWTDQGVAPIYPAFGHRLQNHVTFIGQRDDGLLAHHATEADFIAGLTASGAEVLILGRAEPYGLDPAVTPSSDELHAWSIAAGYRPVAQSQRLTVLVPDGQ